jgi:hypothetical protein
MHVYETKAEGQRQKAGYEIWEYGAKAGVPFSRYGGDVEDVVAAMRHAGYAHAVTVNMFAADLAREEALAALPPELTGHGRAPRSTRPWGIGCARSTGGPAAWRQRIRRSRRSWRWIPGS